LKSKDRVQDLAEVYTNAREVVAMLDLVKDVRYDSTFLEPGCGNGNFIVEILSRKFKLLKNLQEVKQLKKVGIFDELEFRLLLSVASIYGIDIDEENIDECKARMFSLIEEFYTNYTKNKMDNEFQQSLRYVIDTNIILADFLNEAKSISISEFSEFGGNEIQETRYYLIDLLFPNDEIFTKENKLFGHVPTFHQKFNPVNYRKLLLNNANK
jgi:hypothetical protein